MELLIPAILVYLLLASGAKANTDIPDRPIPPTNHDPIKDRYDITIKRFAEIYKIPWQIIKAHIAVESEYGTTPQVMERKLGTGNKRGILGITENTFYSLNKLIKGSFIPEDLWKPEVSIELASALTKANSQSITKDPEFFTRDYSNYTDEQRQKQKELLAKIVMAYHAGAGTVLNNTYSQNTKDYFTKWAIALKEISERQGAI